MLETHKFLVLMFSLLVSACGPSQPGGTPASVPNKPSLLPVGPAASTTPRALLSAIDFVSPMVGYILIAGSGDAGSRQLFATTDGGERWTRVLGWNGDFFLGPRGLPQLWMKFFDQTHGLVVDFAIGPERKATIFRTADAGRTWQARALPATPWPNGGLSFIDWKDGWLMVIDGAAAGSEAVSIYHTLDAGDHWVKVAHGGFNDEAQGIGFGGDKTGIGFVDDSTGWLGVYGPAGAPFLYTTSNGGQHWQLQELPPLPDLTLSGNGTLAQPVFFGGQAGVLPLEVTLVPSHTGPLSVPPEGFPTVLYVYRFANGGWNNPTRLPVVSRNVNDPLVSQFLDMSDWWVASQGNLWVTVDAGRSWQRLRPVLPRGLTLNTLDYVSPADGWAIATTHYSPGTFTDTAPLLRTTDGGDHWTELVLPSID